MGESIVEPVGLRLAVTPAVGDEDALRNRHVGYLGFGELKTFNIPARLLLRNGQLVIDAPLSGLNPTVQPESTTFVGRLHDT